MIYVIVVYEWFVSYVKAFLAHRLPGMTAQCVHMIQPVCAMPLIPLGNAKHPKTQNITFIKHHHLYKVCWD